MKKIVEPLIQTALFMVIFGLLPVACVKGVSESGTEVKEDPDQWFKDKITYHRGPHGECYALYRGFRESSIALIPNGVFCDSKD